MAKDFIPPKDESIFPESKLRPVVLQWNRLAAVLSKNNLSTRERNRLEAESMAILNTIIIDCTEMFKRLAQHEKFHLTVPLDVLVSAAQEKVPKWISKWDPNRGALFSWLSKCAKNIFRGEIVKQVGFQKRIHTTDDDVVLERLSGYVDSTVDMDDAAGELQERLHSITCPWACDAMRGAIRYIIECVLEDNHSKSASIRGASFAWGLDFELSKFLYAWTLISMRDILYDKTYVPMTKVDLLRAAYNTQVHPSSYAPAIMDIVGNDKYLQLCHMFPGMRIRFPSPGENDKLVKDYQLYLELSQSDMDPLSIEKSARRLGRTEKHAIHVFNEMTKLLDPRSSGDYPVYEDDDHATPEPGGEES